MADRPLAERGLARVEAIHVRVALRRPLLDPTGEYTHRRSWLLRLVAGDGREGLGEAAVSPAATETTTGGLAAIMRRLVPALVEGALPAEAELLAEGEPGRAALAAVSGALGMLAATDGRPAGSERQAGARQPAPIPVVATVAFGGADAGAEAAAQAVQLGFGTLELRAGYERRTDQLVERVRAIRAAVGPGPRLRIDAGGAWDLDTAGERLAAIRPFRIEHVEQPLPAWDLTGHAALRERAGVRIALDESLDSEGSVRAAIAERAADVLVVRPARVGGSAVTLRIAAAAAGVAVVLGAFFETGVGIAAGLRLAAALPDAEPARAHGLATAGILAHDLLRTPLPIVDGAMAVPGAVALDEDEIGRVALERVEAAAR